MKRIIGLFLSLSLLILTLFSSVVVSASDIPATKTDYAGWFDGLGVNMLEQKYGTNNLGDTSAHAAPLTLGSYQYQFSSPSGFYADPNDITVNTYDDDLTISFTGTYLPRSICLGIILTNVSGNYLAGRTCSVSVNGGEKTSYTTGETFDSNDFIVVDADGIQTIVLYGHSYSSTTNVYNGLSYLYISDINKLPQDAPAAPVVSSFTDESVTLGETDGVEYSKDGTNWQDSNVFTGLEPVTEYTFYARMKATSVYLASLSSTGTEQTTDKASVQAPSAPAVQSKTADSVTLTPVDGAEYSMDGTSWQDSNVFTGLEPVTEYTFYVRIKETDTHYASAASEAASVTTNKEEQSAPAAPEMQSKTANSVTLEAITGAEYSKDGTSWQDSNVFTGLEPGTEYTFYARMKETDTYYASDASEAASVTTDKGEQTVPTVPETQSKTANSVTLTLVEGAEYSMDGTNWQDSNVFTGLEPNTEYTFYARMKETDTHYASDASEAASVTTDKGEQSVPTVPETQSKTTDSVTLTPVEGAEYSMDGINWQDSNVFIDLEPGTEYTFYIRMKETDTSLASPAESLTVSTEALPEPTAEPTAAPTAAPEENTGDAQTLLYALSGAGGLLSLALASIKKRRK